MGTARLLFCVLAFTFISAQALPQESPTTKKIIITGKLTRVVAIGGETSGWSLEFKHSKTVGGKKMRSVEVSGPAEELQKLKDQHVRVEGTLTHHTGMERGEYMVLEVSSIRAVK
jgi:hypothetical protein